MRESRTTLRRSTLSASVALAVLSAAGVALWRDGPASPPEPPEVQRLAAPERGDAPEPAAQPPERVAAAEFRGAIHGRLVDTYGIPLRGVSVEWRPRAETAIDAAPIETLAASPRDAERDTTELRVAAVGLAVSDSAPAFATATDEEGRFRIDDVPTPASGELLATATPPALQPTLRTIATFSLGGGAVHDVRGVALARPAIVRGRVVDEHGEGVAGIPLWLTRQWDGSRASGEGGRFEIAIVEPQGSESIFAFDHGGYVAVPGGSRTASLRAGSIVDDVVVPVRRGIPVTVRFVDEAKKPIEGVVVSRDGVMDTSYFRSRRQSVRYPELPLAPKSDAKGEVVLSLGPGAEYEILARRDGFRPREFRMSSGASTFEFELEAVETFVLTVLDHATSEPVRDATLYYEILAVEGTALPSRMTGQVNTDASGIARIDDEHGIEGELLLRVFADVHAASDGSAVVRSSAARLRSGEVVVRLGQGGTIRGMVRDTLGRPVEADVSVRSSDSPNPSGEFRATRSNFEGVFELRGLETGEYEVFAYAGTPPRESAKALVLIADDPATPAAVDLVVPAGGTLEGTIRGNDGPIPFRLEAWRVDGGQERRLCEIDAADQFRVNDLDPVPLEVALYFVEDGVSRRLPIPSQRVVVAVGATSRVEFEVDFRQPEFGTISGTVRLDGRATIGAGVTLTALEGSGRPLTAKVDAEGHYSFPAARVGEYSIEATLAFGAAPFVARRVTVIARENLEVDLEARLGSLRGRVIVTDAESRSIRVRLIFAAERKNDTLDFERVIVAASPLAADGSFEFLDVGAGDYILEVEHDDWRRGWTAERVVVRAGEPTTRDVVLRPAGGLRLELADGSAVAGTELVLLCERFDGYRIRAFASRGDDGAFHEDSVPAGAYRVRVGLRARIDESGQSIPFREVGAFDAVIEPSSISRVVWRP